MKNPILSIKNLVFESSKKTNILNIKKFEIHRGACYLLSGSMSSGKTLLLDMMSGNNSKYSGEIFYEDKLISKHPKNIINSEFAYVKQNPSRPFFKTVESYIYDIVKSRSSSNIDAISKKVANIMKIMNIKSIDKYKVRDLTPGQFRWVDLAANIASFPKVLFIDELEMHLSLKDIRSLSKILYRKSNYEGVTIIASTLDKDFFKSLSSINVTLNDGRITSVRSAVNSSKKHK